MRRISAKSIIEGVSEACIRACIVLPDDVLDALRCARDVEESPAGIEALEQLVENASIAVQEQVPICQDTGVAVIFVELGQDMHVVDGGLIDAINQGVRRGYEEGFLRKSVVRHPLDRVNTQDNTPAVIHTEVVPGERLRITVVPKGAGSENMSSARVLPPAEGADGVRRLVVDAVVAAGPNACPPFVVGVGIGGTLEQAVLLSKKAAVRRIGTVAAHPADARLEKELLDAVNATGVGPSGLGGRVTAFAVHVESHPCHIGSLPVAVALQCHAVRRATFEL